MILAKKEHKKYKYRYKPGMLGFFLSAVLVFGLVFLYALIQTEITRASFAVAEQKNNLARLKNQHEYLKVNRAKMASLDHIETVAREKLGMINPDKIEFIAADKTPERQKTDPVGNITEKKGIMNRIIQAVKSELSSVEAKVLDRSE